MIGQSQRVPTAINLAASLIRSRPCSVPPAAGAAAKNSRPRGTSTAVPVHCSVWSGIFAEKFLKQTLCPLETLLGEDHRLGFTAWIRDESPFVQAIHGFPVEALPRSCPVVQPKVEQRKHCIVDLVGVKFHMRPAIQGNPAFIRGRAGTQRLAP